MIANAGKRPCLGIVLTAVVLCLLSTAMAGQPEVDCRVLPHWTSFPDLPQVNQRHVFCGEWVGNVPRGLHSRPGGINPSTVGRFTVSQAPNAQGIYGGQWTYRGQPHREKFSTMFPDTCSMQAVLNSIVHAVSHHIPCPANAPAWARCGLSRPHSVPPGAGPYCDTSDGTVFTIAMGLLANGNVNTAFPLR